MDLKKIFLKDACPTKIGGQAIMEGGYDEEFRKNCYSHQTSDNRIYLKTEKNKELGKISKIPVLRGVYAFVDALVSGTRTLMKSAEILEKFSYVESAESETKFERWLEKSFAKRVHGMF